MLGLKFERSQKYFEELHTERLVATQIRKDDDEGQIINRTFNVYEFEDEAKIKELDGPPPFWSGIIPGDPSTYRNPITEPINSHYIVRSTFTITEYTGYLMFGEPIENMDELRSKGAISDDFINPADVNLFNGWFKKTIDMYSYDYYVPVRTGQEFRWEVELIKETISAPDYTGGGSKRVFVGTYPTDNFDDEVSRRANELEEQGYTITSSTNVKYKQQSDDFSGEITAVKNIFNTGGVYLTNYILDSNTTVFEIQRNGTGVAIKFTIKNCKAWFSSDGITKEDTIFTNHLGTRLTQSVVVIERLKIYKYIIIEPNIPFTENIVTSITGEEYLSYPPIKFKPKTNEGFTFIAEFIGKHYLHFKEDIIEVSQPELVRSYYTNLNDPKPPTYKLHEYEFIDEDSGSYWDANITL